MTSVDEINQIKAPYLNPSQEISLLFSRYCGFFNLLFPSICFQRRKTRTVPLI